MDKIDQEINSYHMKIAIGGHFDFGPLATLCPATQKSTKNVIALYGPLNSNQESNSLPQRVHTAL